MFNNGLVHRYDMCQAGNFMSDNNVMDVRNLKVKDDEDGQRVDRWPSGNHLLHGNRRLFENSHCLLRSALE